MKLFSTSKKKNEAQTEKIYSRSTLIPAAVFALVAVCIGLVISFILDNILAETISDVMNMLVQRIGNGYKYTFGEEMEGWYDENVLEEASYSLGAITIWLLSCLGGITGSLDGVAVDIDLSVIGDVSLSLGICLMLVIPIFSLLIARMARNGITRMFFPGKEPQFTDAIAAAGFFTVINIVLSLFPRPFVEIIAEGIEAMGDFEHIDIAAGVNILPLILFSFVTAFLMSMPRLPEGSCVAVKRYAVMMLSAGLIMVVTVLLFIVIRLNTDGFFHSERWEDLVEEGVVRTDIIGIIALIQNLAVWCMSLLTGGSLVLTSSGLSFLTRFFSLNSVYERTLGTEYADEISIFNPIARVRDISAEPFGIYFDSDYFTMDVTWFGVLLLVAGLLISLAAIYKTLRNTGSFAVSAAITISGSAFLMWFFSTCAALAVDIDFNFGFGEEGFFAKLSSASFINVLLCVLVISCAALIVWGARKSPGFDNVVKKLANPVIALTVTVVAVIVACLTLNSEIILW